jgi:hypothetical protein
MSEYQTDCDRFEALLLEGGSEANARDWHDHLAGCASCREQWTAHQMLVATFAEEAVPELSPAFEAGLQRKLDAAIEVRPLRGWRIAALAAYAAAAVAFMRWILIRFPLPEVVIDPSSPWTAGAAMIAVPLTLWLTATATRLLPATKRRRRAPSPPMALL